MQKNLAQEFYLPSTYRRQWPKMLRWTPHAMQRWLERAGGRWQDEWDNAVYLGRFGSSQGWGTSKYVWILKHVNQPRPCVVTILPREFWDNDIREWAKQRSPFWA